MSNKWQEGQQENCAAWKAKQILAFQLSEWSQSCKLTGEMRLKVYEGNVIRESSEWKIKSSERKTEDSNDKDPEANVWKES